MLVARTKIVVIVDIELFIAPTVLKSREHRADKFLVVNELYWRARQVFSSSVGNCSLKFELYAIIAMINMYPTRILKMQATRPLFKPVPVK